MRKWRASTFRCGVADAAQLLRASARAPASRAVTLMDGYRVAQHDAMAVARLLEVSEQYVCDC